MDDSSRRGSIIWPPENDDVFEQTLRQVHDTFNIDTPAFASPFALYVVCASEPVAAGTFAVRELGLPPIYLSEQENRNSGSHDACRGRNAANGRLQVSRDPGSPILRID